MKKQIFFKDSKHKLQLTSLNQDTKTMIWYFEFEQKIYLQTSSLWRVFHKSELKYVSTDNNLKFRYDVPSIDTSHDVISFISMEHLVKIEFNNELSDLYFYFTHNKFIIIHASSTAFENWDLSIFKKQYICMQNCDIVIFENEKHY